MAQDKGWTVQVMSTPAAVDFINAEALKKQTVRPLRS